MPHRARPLLEVEERVDRGAHQDGEVPALVANELRQVDHDTRERRQVGAKALEQVLERRDHEDQQDDRDDESDDQYRSGVGQRLLDLFLDRLGLFLVGGDLVQQRLERTSLLTSLNEVHEQVVKVDRVLGQRFGQGATALDVSLDGQDQLLHRLVSRGRYRRSRRPVRAEYRRPASWRAGGRRSQCRPA